MTLIGNILTRMGAGIFLLTAAAFPPDAAAGDSNTTWAPYSTLLATHVEEHDLEDGGLVSSFDYQAALDSEQAAELIRQQREILAHYDTKNIESREHALAFWINAYNFFMIAYILDHPVDGDLIESVRDYGSLLNPYRVFDRKLFDIGGADHALSQIELEILLGEEFAERGWKDARVHFAVNCASLGCPPLRNRPYTADNADALLAENTRRALSTPLHMRAEDRTLWLTSLFDWYEHDFVEDSGSVRDFIRDHADADRADRIERIDRIRFIDYDWQLNSRENIIRYLERNP